MTEQDKHIQEYLASVRQRKVKQLQEQDHLLLQVLKKVQHVQFDYSTDSDFEVKLYILELIAEHHT